MMLGDSSSALLGSPSGDAKAVATAANGRAAAAAGGGFDVGSKIYSASEEDNKLGRNVDGERSFGGIRWPRQETMALLKLRSDMDQVFKDSSLKGPLWKEVSRKLTELGYNRSAKKCKEKFENVYKYHKRTKDGRAGKPEGKHYKFFNQLQALDHHSAPQAPLMQASTTEAIPWTMNPPSSVPHMTNIITSSAAASPVNAIPQTTVTTPPINPTVSAATLLGQPLNSNNLTANLFSSSTTSSTASEEYSEELQAGTRKRKWKMFFKRLTKQVIYKQEELQVKFLEEIERRERERIVREEAWRIQEITIINREHEIFIQERSTAAAKDAAIIAFLQKISSQQQIPVKENPKPQTVQSAPAAPAPATSQPQKALQPGLQPAAVTVMSSSSSRWPKAEVQALIKFRSELVKYQENGSKGPLWEEISAAMRSIGYSRNAKRCKEKWENINKYYKKVKESNRKRPEDSKTCPYFDQLDALYKEKSNKNVQALNHTTMAPLMVQPEQQLSQNQPLTLNSDQIQEDDEEAEGDSEDDNIEEEEEEEEEEGYYGGYEIIPNKAPASMGKAE